MTHEQLRIVGWVVALTASAVMWFALVMTVTAVVELLADLVG